MSQCPLPLGAADYSLFQFDLTKLATTTQAISQWWINGFCISGKYPELLQL